MQNYTNVRIVRSTLRVSQFNKCYDKLESNNIQTTCLFRNRSHVWLSSAAYVHLRAFLFVIPILMISLCSRSSKFAIISRYHFSYLCYICVVV